MNIKLQDFKKTPQAVSGVTTLVYGLAVHMFGMVNTIHNYDDIAVQPTGVGTTLASGRWFLKCLRTIGEDSTGNFNLPWLNALLLILFVSCAAVFLVSALRIKSRWIAGLIGAALISFPSVTAILFFKFTAPHYGLAILLSICAVWTTERWRLGFLVSILLLALSLGIYQAYFPLAVSLYLIILIKKALKKETSFGTIVKKGFFYLGTLAGGLIVYFITLKVFLKFENMELGSYQGINSMGATSLTQMLCLIKKAMNDCLLLPTKDYCKIAATPMLKNLYLITGLVSVALVIYLTIKNRKKKTEILAIAGLCVLLPVGINSVALMGSEVIYTLMVLAFFLWMCLPLVLWDMAGNDNGYSKREKVFGKLIVGIVIVMIFLNSYFANVNHTALYYANCRVKSAVESIVVQVYQQEGYNTGKKWAFIGNAGDKAFYPLDWGAGYLYDGNPKPSTLMNAYSRGKWFQIYLSRPITQQANASEQKKLMELPEVVAMPTWPDNGSVKVIGEYVVVKFSE